MKIRISLALEPTHAAALYRLCDKINFQDAQHYLYPHLPAGTRSEQAHDMMTAATQVQKALADAGVNAHPWIDTIR